jgi:UDP-N-acetylmuramoyl-tripeptide--D-alanyl-D-alanine ligase
MRIMTALWTSHDIAAAVGGTASAAFEVTGVSFDSREVEPGHLFVALTGEATDGHRFVSGAFERGAAGVLVSQPVDGPHILVADTMVALNALGMAARARVSAQIIGVTGSAGKTGTKEALAAALSRANRGPVHRSVKSYNNHTGVPLSLSRMPSDTRFGVFEMGMNHAGELAELTQLVRPHVAIVTTIASAHREFFKSEEAIADAKGEIFGGLEPGGTAIIPYDSPYRDRLIAAARLHTDKIITFGLLDGADVRAVEVMEVEKGQLITAMLPGTTLCFTLSQPGAHWVSNAMAVLAAVQAVGGDLAAAGLALADLGGLAGRGAQHQIAVGDGQALLIDESYNANPASMVATLAVLGKAQAARRIAVLGEMRELGEQSAALHTGLVDAILAADVKIALLVGPAMVPLAKALEGKITCRHVADAAAALEQLTPSLQAGDAILIKGSNAVGLSRLVAVLAGGV